MPATTEIKQSTKTAGAYFLRLHSRYLLTADERIKIDRNFRKAVIAYDTTAAQKLLEAGANANMLDPAKGFGLLLSLLCDIKPGEAAKGFVMAEWLLHHNADPQQTTHKDLTLTGKTLHKGSTILMLMAHKWPFDTAQEKLTDLLLSPQQALIV